jgi:hypothetical protein
MLAAAETSPVCSSRRRRAGRSNAQIEVFSSASQGHSHIQPPRDNSSFFFSEIKLSS